MEQQPQLQPQELLTMARVTQVTQVMLPVLLLLVLEQVQEWEKLSAWKQKPRCLDLAAASEAVMVVCYYL